MTSIANKTIEGIKWNILDQVVTQGTNFILGIVLMRMIDPSDFGLIAMATIFYGFLIQFSKFGLSASLVQAKTITKEEVDTLFWFTNMFGILLALIMFLLSWPISKLYDSPILVPIIQVLAIGFVLIPIGLIPQGLLQREMDFKKTFKINVISVILTTLLTVILAIKGFGVWALVIQRISLPLLTASLVFFVVKYRPSFYFSKQKLKKHLKFGLPFFGSKTILYWVENADNLLIGYFFGSQQLGFYSRAYAITTAPASQLGVVLFRVLFPAFSKLQNNKKVFESFFLKFFKALLFVIFPIMLFLSLIAKPLINVIAGESWSAAVFPLKMLAIMAMFKVTIKMLHNVMISQGHVAFDLKFNLYSGLLYITIFIIGALHSIKLLVILYTALTLVLLFVYLYFSIKKLEIKGKSYYISIITNTISFAVLYIIWLFFIEQKVNNNHDILVIFTCGVFVLVSWLIINFLLHPQTTENQLKILLRMVLKNENEKKNNLYRRK